MFMPERNGTGWKVATILGALLCASLGGLLTGGTMYMSHIAWSNQRSSEIEASSARAESQREAMTRDVQDVRDNQAAQVLVMDGVKENIGKLARSVDRLTERICFMQTGKPCPDNVRRD